MPQVKVNLKSKNLQKPYQGTYKESKNSEFSG